MTIKLPTKLAGVLLACSLVAAACGDEADTTATDSSVADSVPGNTDPITESLPESSQPAETNVPNDTTPSSDDSSTGTTDASDGVPSAIVSLSPTATEMLYAIGAADQVLAVDDFSNYPPETAAKMIGLNAFEPNVESIAALEPDLVVTDGSNPDFLGQLDAVGIAHWEGPAAASFDDVYDQIEALGQVTGHADDAAALVAEMQSDVALVVSELPELDEALTYYHELDPTYFSVSPDTFIGAVYATIGLVNIVELADGDLGAYPQLSAEYIIEADPDLIFEACSKVCGETAETVAARPGWSVIAAVRHGGVVELDDDVASRWGPRIVDFLEQAGAAVDDVAAAMSEE